MLAMLLPLLGGIFDTVAKNLFPNPEDELKRLQMQQQLQLALMDKANEMERLGAGIVSDEAKSENWLASSWRPLVMLTFTALIVARWLGYSAPGISEPEVLKLWDIVQLGLGGYVIGRSAEKIVPQVAAALGGKK